MKADNPFNLLPPAVMAQVADDSGVYKANKHPAITYLSAFTAGIFISIAFVFILLRPLAHKPLLLVLRNLSVVSVSLLG